jgi:hypothetical protein
MFASSLFLTILGGFLPSGKNWPVIVIRAHHRSVGPDWFCVAVGRFT